MENTKIRVLIVDDHPMVRQRLALMIRSEASLEWMGEAGNGVEAVDACAHLSPAPNVVLMDFMMPEMDGVTATSAILSRNPKIKVVMLTSYHDSDVVQRALQVGAVGYLLKTASAEDLVDAIRSAFIGKRVPRFEAATTLIKVSPSQHMQHSEPVGSKLTEREREILLLMAQGMSNSAIAARLFVTVPTVKFHATHILGKLSAGSRTEAVLVAIKHRLVPIPN